MDDHLRAWLRAVSTLPGGHAAEIGDAVWVRTGIDWPLFNGGIGDDPLIVETAVEALRERGRPFFWWGATRAVEKVLRKAGLVVVDADMPWLEAPTSGLPALRLPPGVRVEEVVDEAAQRTWARTLREVHDLPASGERAWLEPGRLSRFGRLPWRMWTAYADNDPVGVTLLFCGGGVASLMNIGVTEDNRRRGIGTALTLAPLVDAREPVAGVFVTDDAAAMYQRLGFRARATLSRWLWTPETRFTLRPGAPRSARVR